MEAGIYRHYKGGCEGSIEQPNPPDRLMVVYVSLTEIALPGPRLRVRDVREFNEEVFWPTADASQPRFMPVSDSIK